MTFLRRFLRGNIPIIEDPVLGRLKFEREAWTRGPKESGEVMLVVVAPVSGPTDPQREFYQKLTAALAATVGAAKEFVQASDAGVDIASLSLYAIEIGANEEIARGAFTIELSDV